MEPRKYRGISVELGYWVYGQLVYYPFPIIIQGQSAYEVAPLSIGESLMVGDRKGCPVYTGDYIEDINNVIYEVKYNPKHACFSAFRPGLILDSLICERGNFLVIGNTYQNPEIRSTPYIDFSFQDLISLMKEGKQNDL